MSHPLHEPVRVCQVSLDYGDIRALDKIDLVLHPATITGLIGPNGAGKTSLMRAIVGLQPIDRGQILIGGLDLAESPRESQKMIGYVPDSFGIFQDLTVRQALTYQAACHHVPTNQIAGRIEWAVAALGLLPLLDRESGHLSRGQRQRLAIGQAIVYHPQLLVLDEPASGLDPDSRAHLSETFTMLAAMGMTLLVSSHILAELADYATDIAIMDRGKLVERSTLRAVSQPVGQCRILFATPPEKTVPEKTIPGLDVLSRPSPTEWIIADPAIIGDRARLIAAMIAAGLPIVEVTPVTGNLIDLYRRKIGASQEGTIHANI